MVRPYAVKWQKKLKKRPRVEEEEEEEKEEVLEGEEDEALEEGDSGGEEREESTAEDDRKAEDAIDLMPGIPLTPAILDTKKKPGAIFVLERASLEVAKVGKVCNLEILQGGMLGILRPNYLKCLLLEHLQQLF